MPYKTVRLKGGRVRATNKSTGKKRTFRSKGAFKRWSRVARAYDHGWRPRGRRH
jgi:hypothetical protein